MTNKNLPIQYPTGIENMFISFMDGKDVSDVLPTYKPDVYEQTNIVTVGIAGNSQTYEKWASNKLIISITRNTKFTLTYDLAGLNREIVDKMEGVERVKGIAFSDSNAKEMPEFANGFVFPLNDGGHIARWYPRCRLTPAEEKYQTFTEEMDVPDQQYVIEALPLLKNGVTKVDFYDLDPTNEASKIQVADFMAAVISDPSMLDNLKQVEVKKAADGGQ